VNVHKKEKMVFTFSKTTHATFFNERPKIGHRIYQAINEMSSMETSFTNVNLISRTWVALRTGLTDCSCLCCSLLTVALNQWFSTFFVSRPITTTHSNPTTPSKTRIKKCNTAIYIKHPLVSPPKMVHDPCVGRDP